MVFLSEPLINYPDDNTDTGTNDGKDASCNNKGTCDISTEMCTCDTGFSENDCNKFTCTDDNTGNSLLSREHK